MTHFWASNLQENFISCLNSTRQNPKRKSPKVYVVCGELDDAKIVARMKTELQAEKLANNLNQMMQDLSD